MRVRGLRQQSGMGLYLFLDLEELVSVNSDVVVIEHYQSSVRVLTDAAFGSFLTLKRKDNLIELECCACG